MLAWLLVTPLLGGSMGPERGLQFWVPGPVLGIHSKRGSFLHPFQHDIVVYTSLVNGEV